MAVTKTEIMRGTDPDKRPCCGSCHPDGRGEQLRRITRYETLLQELQSVVFRPEAAAEELLAAGKKAEALGNYLESDDWKRDFADEEAGLIPKELKRGVLSEDGIYSILELYRERMEELIRPAPAGPDETG